MPSTSICRMPDATWTKLPSTVRMPGERPGATTFRFATLPRIVPVPLTVPSFTSVPRPADPDQEGQIVKGPSTVMVPLLRNSPHIEA